MASLFASSLAGVSHLWGDDVLTMESYDGRYHVRQAWMARVPLAFLCWSKSGATMGFSSGKFFLFNDYTPQHLHGSFLLIRFISDHTETITLQALSNKQKFEDSFLSLLR